MATSTTRTSTVTYTYDALYRLTGATRTGTNALTTTYGYDLAGNITTVNGSAFATYSTANKITALTGSSVGYHTGGNLYSVASGGGHSLAYYYYNSRDLMRTQQKAVGGSATLYTYYYDAEGKRIRRQASTSSGSSQKYYLFDGKRLIGEFTSGGPNTAEYVYTWGADGLVSLRIVGSSQSYYYHFGPQGETRHLTNSSGNIANSYWYNAYGKMTASSGTVYNRHKYGGKVGYFEEESTGSSGSILATWRWYHPTLMRWLTRDPIHYAGGDNLYGYVAGNPIKYWDAYGLDPYGAYANGPAQEQSHTNAFRARAERGAGKNVFAFNSPSSLENALRGAEDITRLDIHSHGRSDAVLTGDPLARVYLMDLDSIAELIARGEIDLEQGAAIRFFGCNQSANAQYMSEVLGLLGRPDITVSGAASDVYPSVRNGHEEFARGRFNVFQNGHLLRTTPTMSYDN